MLFIQFFSCILHLIFLIFLIFQIIHFFNFFLYIYLFLFKIPKFNFYSFLEIHLIIIKVNLKSIIASLINLYIHFFGFEINFCFVQIIIFIIIFNQIIIIFVIPILVMIINIIIIYYLVALTIIIIIITKCKSLTKLKKDLCLFVRIYFCCNF
jgi:hypothetical protein